VKPPVIFISYARDNLDYATKLREQFKILERDHRCKVWWDPELRPGDGFEKKIKDAIDQCSLAILFISGAFLKSDFINEKEVPWIREREDAGLATVVPVLMESCAWVQDRWLKSLNIVPTGARPIWGDGGAHVSERITSVVDEIVRLLDDRNPAPKAVSQPRPDRPLTALRVIEHELTDATCEVLDHQGRLWLANAQLLRIYPASKSEQNKPLAIVHLPERRWKCHLTHLWNGHFVLGDWTGGVLLMDVSGIMTDLTPNFDGGLPVHLLATGPEGQLAAATWDGHVRVWDQSRSLMRTQQLKGLPTILLPMRGHALAIVEDHTRLTVFEADGTVSCSWDSPEPLTNLWPCEDNGQRAFIAQAGATSLVKFRSGHAEPERIRFASPITALSHCGEQASNEWVCIGRKGGFIDWVTESPFRVLTGGFQTRIDGEAASLVAILMPDEAAQVMAVGLKEDHQLFTVNGIKVAEHRLSDQPDRLTTDTSGRLLLLSYPKRSEIFRNPGLPTELPKFELQPVQDRVVEGQVRLAKLVLRNTGTQAIILSRAQLEGPGNILGTTAKLQAPRTMQPAINETLEFSVKALVSGDALQATLKLTLADETGAALPTVELDLMLSTLPLA